jgi:DNA-binding CsgD family transcriptional regulator
MAPIKGFYGVTMTERQLDIIDCAAVGMRARETAKVLGISIATVYVHRKLIMRKMSPDNMGVIVAAYLRGDYRDR